VQHHETQNFKLILINFSNYYFFLNFFSVHKPKPTLKHGLAQMPQHNVTMSKRKGKEGEKRNSTWEFIFLSCKHIHMVL